MATAQPDTPLYGPDDGPAPSPTTSLDPRSGPPTADPDDAVDDSYRRRSQFVPLDNPQFIAPGEATFLTPDDRVLGLTINGESRAYPIRMMTYHHIANDTIAGSPVLITF